MICLFLYTELAGYTLACLKALEKEVDAIHVVRYPVNNEAPFNFDFSEKTTVYERTDFTEDTLLKLALDIEPDVTFVSGWIDKAYLRTARILKKKGPVIVGLDNQWTGGVKQRLASLMSYTLVRKYFSHAWVPGDPQYQYARKLGFRKTHVLTGVYAADVDLFEGYYKKAKTVKEEKFPHKFLYIGRYVDWKGINEMWTAFQNIQNKKDWELWCVGAGELYDKRPQTEGIKHLGFVQPDELEDIVKQTSVFILPSKFEPWAVSVHEYAAAGFPLICSDKVGATTAFLNKDNGWILPDVTVPAIQKIMEEAIGTSDEDLTKMGENSRKIAYTITPQSWAKKIIKLGTK